MVLFNPKPEGDKRDYTFSQAIDLNSLNRVNQLPELIASAAKHNRYHMHIRAQVLP